VVKTAPSKRRNRLWALVTFLVLVIVILSDERDHLQHLADLDKSIAAAVGSVSVYSIYSDYSERIDGCDYRWFVVCVPKSDEISLASFLTHQQPPAPSGVGGAIAAAITNLPKLPDATVYALHKRWSQGWAPFTLSLVFLLGCVALVLGLLKEKNVIGAFFVPIAMLFALWAVKHVFLLVASGAWLFLEALILIGGVPALVATCLKLFNESRELAESAKAAHSLKGLE